MKILESDGVKITYLTVEEYIKILERTHKKVDFTKFRFMESVN